MCVGKGRKHYGKTTKCLLPVLSPFPTRFLKAFLLRVVKSREYVVKSSDFLNLNLTQAVVCLTNGLANQKCYTFKISILNKSGEYDLDCYQKCLVNAYL